MNWCKVTIAEREERQLDRSFKRLCEALLENNS